MATTEPDGRKLVLGDQTFDLALDFFLCPVHGLIVPDRFDQEWDTKRGCPVPTYREEPCDEKLTAVFLNTLVDGIREKARKEVEARCEEHCEWLEDFLGRVTEWTGSDEDELAEAIDALGAIHTALNEDAALASLEVSDG